MNKFITLFCTLAALLIGEALSARTPQILINNSSEIYQITPSTMLQFDWAGQWRFVPRINKNWQQYPAEGIDFELKNCIIKLDTLSPDAYPKRSQGVIYKKFTSPCDGYAVIGMAADWWFEAVCNGDTYYTTFPRGNAFAEFSHKNHQFMLKIKKGENVLAVRLQRGDGPGWTFACGKVDFFLPPLPSVRTQPYLLNPANGKMSIGFETYGNIGAGVDYRLQGSDQWQRAWSHDQGIIKRDTVHLVHLENLQEGAVYEYRTVMIDPVDPTVQIIAPVQEYRTFRVPSTQDQSFSFIFTADLQFAPEQQIKILRQLFQAADAATCDYIVLGGDMYDFLDMRILLDGIISEVNNLDRVSKKSHPLIIVRGNHELRGKDTEKFNDLFGTSDGKSYGIYNIGKTALLKLDSGDIRPSTDPNSIHGKYNVDNWIFDVQKKFLSENLPLPAWKNAEKRILLAHMASYSHSEKNRFNSRNMRNLTDKYFAGKSPQYQLALMLAGHIHSYQRTLPGSSKIAGFTKRIKPSDDGKNYFYTILSAAGPSLRDPIQSSVFRITVMPGKLDVKTFAPDGKLIEHFEISDQGKVTGKRSLKHL